MLPMDMSMSMSISMVKFSTFLISLFTVNQVTGPDPATKTFLEVRDSVRLNAAVYKDKILPLTEEVIRKIGFFADTFIDFDFEDWADSLGDTIEDIDKAISFCEILRQMHRNVISDLKRNEDKAHVKIKEMEVMTKRYKEMFIKEHAKVASITTTVLIPAVEEFVTGMEASIGFLGHTKETLAKMKNYGEKGAQERYFKVMRTKAKELSASSRQFLMMTNMMRTDIAAIPEEPNDKNHVNIWFNEQLKQLKEEDVNMWAKLKNATIGRGGITFRD